MAIEEQQETTNRLIDLITESGNQTRASSDGTTAAARDVADLAESLRHLVADQGIAGIHHSGQPEDRDKAFAVIGGG